MLLLAVRLRWILWDISQSFVLRIAIITFTIILIYAVAQVNVVRLFSSLEANAESFTILNFLIAACVESTYMQFTMIIAGFCFQFTCHFDANCQNSKHWFNHTHDDTYHRLCPLPHYIVVSCCLGYFVVAIFLRLPVVLKFLLLVFMTVIYVLFIELSHSSLFKCYDNEVK